MKMTTFLTRFPDEVITLMTQAAAKRGVTIAKLIRLAVLDFLHEDGFDVRHIPSK